jgi:hypothetical protein
LARNRNFEFSFHPDLPLSELKKDLKKLTIFFKHRAIDQTQIISVLSEMVSLGEAWAKNDQSNYETRLISLKQAFIHGPFRFIGPQILNKLNSLDVDEFYSLMIAQNALGICVNRKEQIQAKYITKINTLLCSTITATQFTNLLKILVLFERQLDMPRIDTNALKSAINSYSKEDNLGIARFIHAQLATASECFKGIYKSLAEHLLQKDSFLASLSKDEFIEVLSFTRDLGITLDEAMSNKLWDRLSPLGADGLCAELIIFSQNGIKLNNQLCSQLLDKITGTFQANEMLRLHSFLGQNTDLLENRSIIDDIFGIYRAHSTLESIFQPPTSPLSWAQPVRRDLRWVADRTVNSTLGYCHMGNMEVQSAVIVLHVEVMVAGQRRIIARQVYATPGQDGAWAERSDNTSTYLPTQQSM